jgi:hypothetical protein
MDKQGRLSKKYEGIRRDLRDDANHGVVSNLAKTALRRFSPVLDLASDGVKLTMNCRSSPRRRDAVDRWSDLSSIR